MKTPEQMAEDKAYELGSNNVEFEVAKDAFLAGYQAAKDRILQLEKLLKEANDTVAGMADECEGLKTIIYDHDETNLLTPAKWISVKERLPEEDVDVAIGWFQKTASNKTFWTVDAAQLTNKVFSGWRVYPEVTHWMPLPKPPEKAHD